tara:strand:- start:82 stop:264 length:183 start_codon:yes stop_codon:yes gene_type:complete
MKERQSIRFKLDLLRLELLTIKQLRGNPANCVIKNSVISERILELEESLAEIQNQKGVLK